MSSGRDNFVSGDRVRWTCNATGCSTGAHEGTITGLTETRARDMGLPIGPVLTDEPEPVGVRLDDSPGVISFVSLTEVEHLPGRPTMSSARKHELPIPRDPWEKPVRMAATELVNANWRTILREIRKPAGDDYIILIDGRPVAAVVDYDYYLHLLGVVAEENDAVGDQP